jgi:hypothetical protein
VVVECSDLRVAPDARPVAKPQRDVLVVVEDRNLHGCILPSAFGSKELGQSPRYRLGIVLHRNVAGRLDSDEPRLRNFAGVAFGKVDRLESVVLAPDQKLGRLRLRLSRVFSSDDPPHIVLAEPNGFVVLGCVLQLGEDVLVSERLAVGIDIGVPACHVKELRWMRAPVRVLAPTKW